MSEFHDQSALSFVQFTGEESMEKSFHELLRCSFPPFALSHFDDLSSYALSLDSYTRQCQMKYNSAKQTAKAVALNLISGTDAIMLAGESEFRAERDLWSLLSMATHEDVLGRFSDAEENAKMLQAFQQLPIEANIEDFVLVAYRNNASYKKSDVIRKWIEQCAQDLASSLPPLKEHLPWSDTINLLATCNPQYLTQKTSIKGLHPDAQIDASGRMLPLVGVDRQDQELLLLHLFHLLRAGHLLQAQELALQHQVYWLSASLRGVIYHSNPTARPNASMQEGDRFHPALSAAALGSERSGNVRQPLAHRTSWQHASRLASNMDNSYIPKASGYCRVDAFTSRPVEEGVTTAGMLEMTLYAALSDHVQVLQKSPLIRSWHDKLWIYLKAVNTRHVMDIVHAYRLRKAERSSLFPGCDLETIRVEEEMMALLTQSIGRRQVGECIQLAPPPSGSSFLSMLYQAQAAAIGGIDALADFFQTNVSYLLSNTPAEDVKCIHHWRVLSHLLLWLRDCPRCASALSSAVDDRLLHACLDRYTHCLILSQQYDLVPSYLIYLPRPCRVRKFAYLLFHMQCHGFASSAAESTILQQAHALFPEDLLEGTRMVLECHAGMSGLVCPWVDPSSSSSSSGAGAGAGAQEMDVYAEDSEGAYASPDKRAADALALTAVETGGEKLAGLDQSQRIVALHWFLQAASVDPVEAVAQINRCLLEVVHDHLHRHGRLSSTSTSTFLHEGSEALSAVLASYATEELWLTSVQGLEASCADLSNRSLHLRMRKASPEDFALYQGEAHRVQRGRVEMAKLEWWRILHDLVAATQDFAGALASYRAKAAGLVNETAFWDRQVKVSLVATLDPLRMKVCDVARDLLSGLHEFLTTSPCAGKEAILASAILPTSGFYGLWHQSRVSATALVRDLVRDVKAEVSALPRASRAHSVDKALRDLFQRLSDEEVQMAKSIVEDFSHFQQVLVSEVAEREVGDHHQVSILSKTQQIALLLKDLCEEEAFQRSILYHLLCTYVSVCREAAVVEAVQADDDSHLEAQQWYAKIVHLSEVVASDEVTLQLYKVLRR